jgi:hypothetical protein
MERTPPTSPIEARWPVILAILVVLLLTATLHDRVQVVPNWLRYTLSSLVIAAIAAVPFMGARTRWVKLERLLILIFFGIMEIGIMVSLARLIDGIVNKTQEIDGLRLLTSSVVVWMTNVLMFSLLYWQLDRGGPEIRGRSQGSRPDWLFPQAEVPEDVSPHWQPTYVDYLFLSFTTATAFSPTDALPLTARAKLLMMLESLISLTTIVVVASRAINILSS